MSRPATPHSAPVAPLPPPAGAVATPADWTRLDREIDPIAKRLAARFGFDHHVAADAKQVCFVRLLHVLKAGERIRDPTAWLCRALRRQFLDERRGRPTANGPSRCPQACREDALDCVSGRDAPAPGAPWCIASRMQCWIVRRLPSPHAEVAVWSYLESVRHGEIKRRLCGWGGISTRQAERLIQQTDEMLRAIGRGERPRDHWPARFDPRKNGFLMSGFESRRVK